MKKENHTKLSQICSQGFVLLGTEERVRNNRGKRATSVRAIEVLLYIPNLKSDNSYTWSFVGYLPDRSNHHGTLT